MNHSYTTIREAIYDRLDDLDITLAYPEGWQQRFRQPAKQLTDLFPAFMVTPSRDEQSTLDSRDDSDLFVLSVYLFDSFKDAYEAEGDLDVLVGLVRERFRSERIAKPPLGLDGLYDLSLAGEWGADEERGHRFYRLDITVRAAQEIALPI